MTRTWRNQDVNVRGLHGETALHLLVPEAATFKKIQKLLVDGADIHATDADGRSPLQLAQQLGLTEIVYCMIEHDHFVRALTARLARQPTPNDLHSALHISKMRSFRDNVRQHVATKSHLLIHAARHGDVATVRALVESAEITVDAVDHETGETAFSAALASGRRHVCEFLLAHGAHCYGPCIVDGQPYSTLVAAVIAGDVAFVRRLCDDHGALLATEQYDLDTCALAEAVKRGSALLIMVDTLLEMGAQADPYNRGFNLPWPARHALVIHCDDVWTQTSYWLLALACWHEDTRLMNHLIASHAVLRDPALMATFGASALFLAVYKTNVAITSDLLARGVAINQPIDRGLTAIMAAVAIDSVDMLHFLMARGADTNVVHKTIIPSTGFDESLVTTAVYAGAMACAYELLPLETRPAYRAQALGQAVTRGDVELASRLLDGGLPSTAFAFRTYVRRTTCPLMLDLLLSRCCSTDGENGNGIAMASLYSIFADACQARNADIVEVFLAHGVDINYNCVYETTSPLMLALRQNLEFGQDVARLLLDNGVDFVGKTIAGETCVAAWNSWLRGATSPAAREHLETSRELLLAYSTTAQK